jgi:OPT family oligopeptide transporter
MSLAGATSIASAFPNNLDRCAPLKNSLPDNQAELTVRGMIIGAAITAVFMAANVYLGLRTGMTFSSSIPAAIISLSVLRAMGSAGILENNIVQTQASAAGTLCNVILVLPGLLLIGFWHDFPLWQTMAVCFVGGILGVLYSVPLRRVMVVGSNLPFPEGVAAAEVLRAGHRDEAKTGEGGEGGSGLRELGVSAAAAAALSILTNGLKLLPDKLSGSLSYGHAVFQMGGSLSLALIGAGYLVRIGGRAGSYPRPFHRMGRRRSGPDDHGAAAGGRPRCGCQCDLVGKGEADRCRHYCQRRALDCHHPGKADVR